MLKHLIAAGAIFAAPVEYSYDPDKEVDVALVLAVDISQSMDTDEQEFQRAGYISALTSREFLDAIAVGSVGRIAVTYMEWGGTDEQFIIADWAVIDGADSAGHFAEQIGTAEFRQVQRTSIAGALKKANHLIETSGYTALRRVIDVSGDGPNNQGGSVTDVRDEISGAGVTINGLPLMLKDNKHGWQAMLDLEAYFEDCVTGGPGSFVIPVRSKEGFADAIRMKLVMEIAGLQQPNVHHAAGRKPINCSLFD